MTAIIKKLDKNLLIASSILAVAVTFSFFMVADAKSEADIQFPIAELGNCKDKSDCKNFCDNKENIEKCINFAKEHNLISAKDAERAENFSKVGKGPGGCEGVACKTYCEDISHSDECLAFAKEHGFIEKDEIEKIEKVSKILKGGGETPGGCRGKNECQAYCSESSHAEECLAFAEKAGFMPKEELERARKMLPLMRKGETPGGCKSKDQCEAFCQNPDNFEQCITFAEKAGIMSDKELEMAKKTGGKGPGGCRGRNECEVFCNNPANQETCFNFAKEHGILDESKLKDIKEGMGQMRIGLDKAPEEVRSCLKENLGENIINDMEAGTLTPGPDIGERVRGCFEKFMPKVREKVGEEFNHAPDGVKTCLESAVGKNELEKIRNGEPPKDPETGEKIRACFESAGPHQGGTGPAMMREGNMPRDRYGTPGMPGGMNDGQFGIHNESSKCVLERKEEFKKMMEEQGGTLGEEIRRKMDVAVKDCLKNENGGASEGVPRPGILPEGMNQIKNIIPGDMNVMPPKIEYEYSKEPYSQYPQSQYPAYPGVQETQVKFSFPPESIDCVSGIYGKEVIEKITIGAMPPPTDIQDRINECMSKLRTSTYR